MGPVQIVAASGGGTPPTPPPLLPGAMQGFVANGAVIQTAFDDQGETAWDGRGRFGEGVAAGLYYGYQAKFDTPLTAERVARVGLSFGAEHLDGVGNDVPPVAAVPLADGRVFIASGQMEGFTHAAAVNADDSYSFLSDNNSGSYHGIAAVGVCNPAAGERLAVLSGDGRVSLVSTTTGLNTLGFTPSAPSGFLSSDYNRQNIHLACHGTILAVSYLSQNRVDEYAVGADGASLTFVRSFTVAAPAGLAVGTDGRPLVVCGATFTLTGGATFFELDTTTGGEVLRLNSDGTTTVVAASGFAPNPWRLAVNQSTGEIAVASWGPDHRIRVFNSSWVLQRTFGTSGGRANGTYVGTDFYQLTHLAWESSDLWVCEFAAAARVTRKLNGTTGAVVRTLLGGQRFEASCCPEGGDDPTRVWGHSAYGFNRYSLDPATGGWALLESYQFFRSANYSLANLSAHKELRSRRVGGRVYLYTSAFYCGVWEYVSAGTLRLVVHVGSIAGSGWMTAAQIAAVQSANPSLNNYIWTAPTGSTAFAPTFQVADIVAWNPSSGSGSDVREVNVGGDLSLYVGRVDRPCRIPVSSIRADGVPVYNVAGRVDYAPPVVGGVSLTTSVSDLIGDDGLYVYQVFAPGYGGGGANGSGQYYHSALSGQSLLVKRFADTGNVVWASGLKEGNWNKRAGRTHYVRKISLSDELVWVHHSGDAEWNGGVALYDRVSGLWMGDLTRLTYPDGVHHYTPWQVVNGDICTVNVCDDPDDPDDVLVFTSTISYHAVTRVRGANTLVRRYTPKVVSSSTADAPHDGTGLTVKIWNNDTRSGPPALTLTRNYTVLTDPLLAGITTGPFSFSMEGRVVPIKTGPHRFFACPTNNDATVMRVTVGGTLVSDTSTGLGTSGRTASTAPGSRSAPVQLTALTPVQVLVEGSGCYRSDNPNQLIPYIGLPGDWTRWLGLAWQPPGMDERDIPTTLCYPTGTTSPLPPEAYDAWDWPDYPTEMHWPLAAMSAGRTSGTSVPDLIAHGSVSVVTDADTLPCVEMVSTLNAPAVLYTHASPWPDDYEGWAAGGGTWSVELRLKTTAAPGRDGGFGGWRASQVYGNSYYTLPKLVIYSGGLNVFAQITSEVSGTRALADNNWHTVRIDVTGEDWSVTIDGTSFGSTSYSGLRAGPPHGLAIVVPTPGVSGVSYTWRVRDFKVWPQG